MIITLEAIHLIVWSVGTVLMLISIVHLIINIRDKEEIKFPIYAKIIFLIGLLMYIISFYIPAFPTIILTL
jgi:uncharacterized membrane protein